MENEYITAEKARELTRVPYQTLVCMKSIKVAASEGHYACLVKALLPDTAENLRGLGFIVARQLENWTISWRTGD